MAGELFWGREAMLLGNKDGYNNNYHEMKIMMGHKDIN